MICLLFLYLSSLLIYSTRQELTFLPGVDDLRSGYDGTKMLSASEQRSRFRIFDLSDKSDIPFILKANDNEHTYATPAHAQVTDVSTQKENNCESVSYSFEQFYRSYFQSNSFGIGIPGPQGSSFGMEYQETLKQVYEAITKRSQIVGTSAIWWGLYSMQLAPPSLLKFDSMFNTSVNLLISQGAIVTSEEEQQLYNEFVQSYGTHYVSNVIVGGTVYLYTFVTDTYHSTSAYEETTRQIGLTAMYKGVTFNGGSQTAEIYKQITETFRKNSNTISVFQPPVERTDNQSMLTPWLNKAGNQPVVINRTLSHIANLIRSNRQVREHLRRTIDFYLNNGFLPTLAQLNSGIKTARTLTLSPKSIGPINGLDVVGCGYDVHNLQSRLCILDTSNTSENERWNDPYNQSLSYSLPNGFFATNTPESLTVDALVTVTSVEDYYRLTTRVQVSQSGFIFVRTVTKRTTEFYRRFYQDYYNFVLRLKQIGWYTLSVSIFPYPKMTPIAERAFANLPSTFNPNDTDVWESFIASFGTHLVVASQMGGQVFAEVWYDKCLTYEHTEVWVDEQISTSFFFVPLSRSTSEGHTRQVDERFKQFSTYSSQLLGGTDSIAPEKWEEWIPTIKDNPRPISYRLAPLYELLPEGDQRSALQAAIEYFAEEAKTENTEYIAKLESVRGLPPTKCSRNRVRRSDSSLANSSQANDTTIRDALCPYVGYEGSTCSGLTGRQSLIPVYRRLPTGVGTTIDFTTGILRLPAIDFTDDNTTYWKDPLTNETYWHPREVSVLPVDDTENQPVARDFLNAGELVNFWKYAPTRGEWLGGEFGHSKSILELQSRFFTDDQAIAITHKPYVLYRLKVETLNLNVYVKSAIAALPKVYNEIIYADFLRNWGTHIIMQSLIGGLHEQQVLFKDCVFSFNGAVTRKNLEDYLKQDILSGTLGNSFYAERRKISIDHKLGGNPSLSNVTQWQRSLGANPALLKIEQFTPWHDIIEDPDVQKNLRLIIKNRTETSERIRIEEEIQLVTQRVNVRMSAMKGSIGFLNGPTCEIITPVTLNSVANCSNGCGTGLSIKSSTGSLNDRPLWYIRDPATGFVQARVRLQDGTAIDGVRVSAGCSVISTPNMVTTSASICVGCTLVSSFSNACTCVCPAYPVSPPKNTG